MIKSRLKYEAENAVMCQFRNHLALMPCLAIGVLLVGPILVEANDQIYKTGAATAVRGPIDAVTSDGVSLKVNGVTQNIPSGEIDRILFFGSPSELLRAQAQIRQQQYEEAKNALAGIDKSKVTAKFVIQEIAYCEAVCDHEMSKDGRTKRADASTVLGGFVQNHKDSFHYYDIVQRTGDLAKSMGNYEVAVGAYNELQKAVDTGVQLIGRVSLASTLFSQGDFQQAQEIYQQIAASDSESPEQRAMIRLAQVGHAHCQAEIGQTAEAIAALDAIVKNGEPLAEKDLFARVYNARGAAFRKAEQPKEAVLAYLHTDKLFNQNEDAHAEALYYLGQLWEQLNMSDRAKKDRQLLRTRYGDSVWAKKQ